MFVLSFTIFFAIFAFLADFYAILLVLSFIVRLFGTPLRIFIQSITRFAQPR